MWNKIRLIHFEAYCETAPSIDPETFVNPDWDHSRDYSEYLPAMQKGRLIYSCPMKEFLEKKGKTATFNNEVWYGILEYNNSHVAVAYKPKTEEDIADAHAEEVAYLINKICFAPYTGNHTVPPTIVRHVSDSDRRRASFQFFVETGDKEDLWNDTYRRKALADADPAILEEISVFNFLCNNWDKHPGNYLATSEKAHRVALANIDNESIVNKGIVSEIERALIPSLFSDDPRAQTRTVLSPTPGMQQKDFHALLESHGFQPPIKKERILFNNFTRGEKNTPLLIEEGCLFVRYHYGNEKAFPLPKGICIPELRKAVDSITEEKLREAYAPLIKINSARFSSRIQEVLERKAIYLNSLKEEK